VGDGPGVVGKLRVLPIGLAYEALRGVATEYFLFTEKLARRYLPKRAPKAHKMNHGHLLVAAGSPGAWGAGVLTASSAYRMGAGYVTWASWEEPIAALRDIPEALTKHLEAPELLEKKRPQAIA